MKNLEYRPVTEEEITSFGRECPRWIRGEEGVSAEFEFDAYAHGLSFATAVGFLADRLDHHPDIAVGYKKVKVSVTTHATGGVSPYDFELARRIERLLRD